MMGADEEGTLERLKAHRRELIDPKITGHRGRIVVTIRTPVILAGGLGPGNVAASIAAVRPAVSIPKRAPTATMAVIVKTSISCASSCASQVCGHFDGDVCRRRLWKVAFTRE